MTTMIKLTRGREVTLDEFITWGRQKQIGNLLGVSEEARAKIGAKNSGRRHSPEARARIRAANKGSKHSAETRAKMSAAKKGRSHSKPVMTPYGVYPSVGAVAEASGRGKHVVRRWMKKYPEHYYYTTKETK
jgi:hypothetical protein